MKTVISTLVLAFLVSICTSTGAESDRAENLFEKAMSGRAVYQLASQKLVKLGEEARPLLEREAQSEDWRRRWVAKIALARIDDPQTHARWKTAMSTPGSRLDRRGGDVLVLEPFNPEGIAQLETLGLKSGDVIPEEALPAALDLLMADRRADVHPRIYNMEPYKVLAQHGDEHLFDAALAFADMYSTTELPFYAQRLGVSVLPKLHALFDKEVPALYEQRGPAVRAMRALGSPESAPVLVAVLDNEFFSNQFAEVVPALREIATPAEVPALIELVEQNPLHLRRYRDIILSTGEGALPAIHTIADDPERELWLRAILGGIAYEIRHPEEMEEVYRGLRSPYDLAQNSDEAERVAPEKLAQIQAERGRANWWSYEPQGYISPLDSVPDAIVLERAVTSSNIGFFEQVADIPLAKEYLMQSLISGAYYNQHAKAAARIYGAEAVPWFLEGIAGDEKISAPHHVLGFLLEFGDESAAVIADHIAETNPDAAIVARAIRGDKARRLMVMTGEGFTSGGIEIPATMAFLHQGGLDAIPPAMEMIAEMWFSARSGFNPVLFDSAIASIGDKAIPAIRAAAAESDTPYMEVIAEGLVLRIEDPELAKKYDIALKIGARRPISILGPTEGNYSLTGSQIAKSVGEKGIPLLRMGIVAGGLHDSRGAAVHGYALAHLQDTDSAELIEHFMQKMGSIYNPQREIIAGEPRPTFYIGAEILRALGEAGLDAANNVPAPDPDKPRIDQRALRHARAAATLGGIREEVSLEKVMEGLQLIADGKLEDRAAARYLQLAGEHDDPRLVPLANRVLEVHPDYVETIAAVVWKYDDPSIVPACLGALKMSAYNKSAWQGLTRIKQGDTLDFIIGEIDTETDEDTLRSLVNMLGQFYPGGEVGKLFDQGDFPVTAAEFAEMESRARKLLIRYASEEGDAMPRRIAIYGLGAMIVGKGDPEALRALAKYRIDTGNWLSGINLKVFASGDKEALDMLVAHYREDRREHAHLGQELLVEAGRTDLVPDFVTIIEAYLARRQARGRFHADKEVACLAESGETGRDALLALTLKQENWQFLLTAFRHLAEAGDARAFSRVEEMLKSEIAKRERPDSFAVSLANSLAGMDGTSAYPAISTAALEVPEGKLRNDLAGIAFDLAKLHPRLAQD